MYLFAQQAMRALGAAAQAGGYAFAATSDWDALNDANLRDVRVVIWLNDMPHTAAQRQAFERYMAAAAAGWGSTSPGSATTRGRGSPSSSAAAASAPATGRRCRRASTSTTRRTRS